MPSDPVAIELRPAMFADAEVVLARFGGLTASTFRYRSGVPGLRIANEVARIDLLPFQGQQIWDVQFAGRRLTMRSMFDEPLPVDDFLATYGGFFIHCGALAMGDPGLGDTHPVHGELPNARYQEARLLIGDDSSGPFMALTGRYEHRVAFTHHYLAEPTVRLHGGSCRIGAEMRIRNLRHTPMDLMYLGHVNFRPVAGARILDTVPDDAAHMRVRSALPPPFVPSQQYLRLLEQVTADPARHRSIDPSLSIDPELVLSLDCLADETGWAHSLQLLPDGSADFLSHRPDQLGHGLRWFCQTPEESALGLMLPATAEADGYAAEKAKGNLRQLPPQGEFRCELEFGALDRAGAGDLRRKIEAAVKRASAGRRRRAVIPPASRHRC